MQELGAGQVEGRGDPLERIQRYHALPALHLADIGQAQLRLKRELLLREFSLEPFGAEGGSELALKSGGAIRHVRNIMQVSGARLPIIVNIRDTRGWFGESPDVDNAPAVTAVGAF